MSFDFHPKKLFLIDALGALLTATLLSQVVARFESFFGIPSQPLYWLSILAIIFFLYSFFCHISLKEGWSGYLKIIATANIVYCLLTIATVIFFINSVTIFGFIYFLGEILIVMLLVRFEFRAVSMLYD